MSSKLKVNIKTFLENNNVMIILYIILITFVIHQILNVYKTESFTNSKLSKCLAKKSKNTVTKRTDKDITNYKYNYNLIHSLLPVLNRDDITYYGALLPQDEDNISTLKNNNFVICREKEGLKSNDWELVEKNGKLPNNAVIIDLCYDRYKRIMCVGMYIVYDNPVYNLYIKESEDYESKWILLDKDTKVKSVCFDIYSSKLLGINSYDSQIYECDFNSVDKKDKLKWVGPINYDLPMKKIMFDKEGTLIGIHFYDNFLYKKMKNNWRNSEWDTNNINKSKIFDLCYDKDGCFIASTNKGLKKQLFPDFNSSFTQIKKYTKKHNSIMDITDIVKFRVGYEFIDELLENLSDNELSKDLKRIYEFKKITNDICKNKKYLVNKDDVETNDYKYDEALNKQNRKITELYNHVEKLTSKLN